MVSRRRFIAALVAVPFIGLAIPSLGRAAAPAVIWRWCAWSELPTSFVVVGKWTALVSATSTTEPFLFVFPCAVTSEEALYPQLLAQIKADSLDMAKDEFQRAWQRGDHLKVREFDWSNYD